MSRMRCSAQPLRSVAPLIRDHRKPKRSRVCSAPLRALHSRCAAPGTRKSESPPMAAYGLYTHIQSNKRRSIALLIGLFFLVYLLVYAGALVGEALTIDAPPDVLLRRALSDALYAAPWATLGTAL